MASTFSPSLKLELIGLGDQNGTWGTTTNTNLGTLLEQAITGVQAITMTNANYTLSDLNGISDEARNAVLVVGGTNSAIRSIITPAVNKQYVVKNATLGGFAIIIKTPTSTGVSIANGAVQTVYCDGTEFYIASFPSTGGTITGNLAVTGTLNVTGIPSIPTAVAGTNTTQAASTAFVITNVPATATNAAQLGGIAAASYAQLASPTFTGTPTLPTGAIATTQPAGNNTSALATTAFVVANSTPAGTLIQFAGTTAPTGYLVCPTTLTNISRTTYAALFAAIGTTWGVGDGSTSFGLPWFPADYAKVQANANVGTSSVGAVISHTHTYNNPVNTAPQSGSATQCYVPGPAASTTGATGGTANLAAGVRVLFCIKI